MRANLLRMARMGAAAGRRGVAALEFALVLPVLTLILLTAVDLGTALEQSIRLETAARNGAQYAVSFPTPAADIETQVRNSLPGWTDITIATPTLRCVCPGDASVNCTNENACGVITEQYITISVTRPHAPLLLTPFSTIEGRAEIRRR
jgi:Flp pilus assembly protein TadG